ncbi:fungal-specific transcription factor domain-containing protein [Cercophora newfieldiana]|uniref:Fungal-specific transcription factor domain-containing protein n=1 Tax=Cercophora newfieldiana TaxID=92897 RepID=A0AA39XU21_9PEZI|nr:fungal-specific transcription factor domain-containing protein [Cercophora newfieldiana]
MTTLINGVLPPPKQIRFVNNQGQPPSKRRRINAACLTCRKRKTRCAGEKPICSTCAKNGHECLGYNDLLEKKKEVNGSGSKVKYEAADFSNESEFLDEDDEDERRHWKSKSAGRTAGFAGRDETSRGDSTASVTPPSGRPPQRNNNDWEQQEDKSRRRSSNYGHTSSYSEDGRSSNDRSPVQHRGESHRMPYFRYFGPTAIVPGFKQMVVNVSVNRDRRRSRGNSFSTTSPGSLFGYGFPHSRLSQPETILETIEDLPVYDVNDSAPTHPLIITLIKTFFLHLGCNYPFLREERCLRLVKEKRMEPILVDSMCALAARFSDLPIFTNEHDGRVGRSEYGHIFAQRAKAATVDTFPCPSVQAVQACLLMAYEGFGENQDSALWMYLGLAIRMAVDLGLQKNVGIKYQGERDPWYTRIWIRKGSNDVESPDDTQNDEETLSAEEQKEVEQERTDTFWAVFVLDRLISSGTGRPVTFRDDDYELPLPSPTKDPVTGLADPLPAFTEIIHLYGRVSDVLNNIRDANDLTEEKMTKLAQMESDLTQIYQKQDENLHFNAVNFREYVQAGQGTTFILFHFWFHAIIVVLHQPTLLAPFGSLRSTQLAANSRELSMSSAKTIADILAFAELIDPKSFIGNPFTSQPMYIAACAFLLQSVANTSEPPSRETTPTDSKAELHRALGVKPTPSASDTRAKHTLLVSVANQNYQRCYKSLQQLQQYWGGVGYILTALDQKSKGIWDCETFTNEEYESAMLTTRRGSLGRLARFENPASPNVPPIAFSLTGTTNSPNSNLTLLYQNSHAATLGGLTPHSSQAHPPSTQASSHSHSVPVSAPTPPGNMIYDPIRQSDTSAMFPPAYPQPNVSAVRHQAHPTKQLSVSSGKSSLKYEAASPDDVDPHNSANEKTYMFGGMSQSGHGPPPQQMPYAQSSQLHSNSEAPAVHSGSPNSTFTESSMGQHHSSHYHNNHSQNQNHNHGHNHNHNHGHNQNHHHANGMHSSSGSNYEADFTQSGLVSGSYSYVSGNPLNEIITFDSQEINIDALNSLGLPNEMMPPWLDVLGLFESSLTETNHNHHMG